MKKKDIGELVFWGVFAILAVFDIITDSSVSSYAVIIGLFVCLGAFAIRLILKTIIKLKKKHNEKINNINNIENEDN